MRPIRKKNTVRSYQATIGHFCREFGDADIHQIETDEKKVQIMTMHVSKGLQFPVVFIAGGLTQPFADDYHVYHDYDPAEYEPAAWLILLGLVLFWFTPWTRELAVSIRGRLRSRREEGSAGPPEETLRPQDTVHLKRW